ncbi:hypothetical protein Bca4012_065804 [Brassica carinata]
MGMFFADMVSAAFLECPHDSQENIDDNNIETGFVELNLHPVLKQMANTSTGIHFVNVVVLFDQNVM